MKKISKKNFFENFFCEKNRAFSKKITTKKLVKKNWIFFEKNFFWKKIDFFGKKNFLKKKKISRKNFFFRKKINKIDEWWIFRVTSGGILTVHFAKK